MKLLANSRIGTLFVLLVAPSALFAQNGAPPTDSSGSSALDARQIVTLSIAAAQRSWLARNRNYSTGILGPPVIPTRNCESKFISG